MEGRKRGQHLIEGELRKVTPYFSELEEILRQSVTPKFLEKKVGEDDGVEDNKPNDLQSVKPTER